VVSISPPVTGPASRPPGVMLDAMLERITYANEEAGYTIARVATDRSGTDLFAVLGAQLGESLRLVAGGFASAAWAAVRRGLVHHRTAGDDPFARHGGGLSVRRGSSVGECGLYALVGVAIP
jgi:hypothetical protein